VGGPIAAGELHRLQVPGWKTIVPRHQGSGRGRPSGRRARADCMPHESRDKVALLRPSEPKERPALERRCHWGPAKAKEWLIEREDVGTDIFFLTSGVVRVLITPSPDREVILADINAGGYFGEMAAIDGQPRSAGILAITDATIAVMAS